MRSLWLALGLSLCASAAEAQVQQGSFKLSIDTDVLNVASLNEENSEGDYESTATAFSVGPAGSALGTALPGFAAFSAGYVVHPHVIPQLHFSLALGTTSVATETQGDSQDDDGPSKTAIMLRPELEIPFNPDSAVVAFGLVGFDYRHLGTSSEGDDEQGTLDTEVSINGYGPVLGAGLHIFVGDGIASFDLGAQFSYLVFSQSAEVDGEEIDFDKTDLNAKIFSITAGLSLWP